MGRLFLLSLLLVGGCAKFPEGGTVAGDKRLLFTMRVDGEIRSEYVYIIPLRVSTETNPDSNGPIPVITYPNANGFVAGLPTHFVRYDPLQAQPFAIYRFTNTDLTSWALVGYPIRYTPVTTGGKVLAFEISTTQLADSAILAAALASVQVNFLTMNRTSTATGASRVIDSLGDNRLPSEINEFIRIPLTTSGTYDNQRFNFLEPPSDSAATRDCPEPDLDISDWSVEVRL
ncbi:MAG: hypothetical protein ACOYON_00485 [Fimbriimonas sp.]